MTQEPYCILQGTLSGSKVVSPQVQLEIAQHNIIRGWIELIVKSAKQLGFNVVLHGFAIVHHSSSVPHAVSWLAVMDEKAVMDPS